MKELPAYKMVVEFHGHSCPGLAMGYRLTAEALEYLGVTRAADEELVVIVENDACGTDAVQFLSGCTFGKGNFIFKDLGKMAYSFYNRKNGRSVRVIRKNEFRDKLDKLNLDREAKIDYILNCPVSELVEFKEAPYSFPPEARLINNELCPVCGESVMQTRMKQLNAQKMCITCYDNRRKNG
jgi:formylmethanofuran dehydrogenase subunit E